MSWPVVRSSVAFGADYAGAAQRARDDGLGRGGAALLRAGGDAGARRGALKEDGRPLRGQTGGSPLSGRLVGDGHGPRLHDVQLAVLLRPLDVLRPAVVLLHPPADLRHRHYLRVGELLELDIVLGYVRPGVVLLSERRGLDVAGELLLLAFYCLLEDVQRRLVHNVQVGRQRARHYRLSEAAEGLEYNLGSVPAYRF